MSVAGVEWDDAGNATLYADGHSGDGRISGVSPHTAMYFAVALARSARARGVPWPTSFYDDPWEAGAVRGLQVATEEASPEHVPPPAGPDLDALSRTIDVARNQLRNVAGALDELDDIVGN